MSKAFNSSIKNHPKRKTAFHRQKSQDETHWAFSLGTKWYPFQPFLTTLQPLVHLLKEESYISWSFVGFP